MLAASQGQTGPQPWDPLVLELNDYLLEQVESVTCVQPRAHLPRYSYEQPWVGGTANSDRSSVLENREEN